MLSNITITPEMIAAGADAAREHALGAPLEEMVRLVYIAMVVEQDQETSAEASETMASM